jgi:hypothetical protein
MTEGQAILAQAAQVSPAEPQPVPGQAELSTSGDAPTPAPPAFIAPRTEGGAQMQEGASAYLPDGTPIDNIGIVRATITNPITGQPQEVTAAATDPSSVTGGITRTLAPTAQPQPASQGSLIERYLQSAVHRAFGGSIGRGPIDLGLIGQGHTVTGHMVLMDAESGELHRALPGARIEEDRVYINTRNLPEWLAEGDVGRRLVGGGA